MELNEILSRCDHTLLKPECTWEQIREVCDDGLKFNCASVCIPAGYVKQAGDYLGDSLKICTVIGFPNGYSTTAVKVFETEDAIRNGADEIDMVINIGWVKDRRWDDLLAEMPGGQEQLQGPHPQGHCGGMPPHGGGEDSDVRAGHRVRGRFYQDLPRAFPPSGATREDVKLFRAHIGPGVKVKAAGGIRTLPGCPRTLLLWGPTAWAPPQW